MTNTMYVDESQNWMISCLKCYEEFCSKIQDQFDDINSDIMRSIQDAMADYRFGR